MRRLALVLAGVVAALMLSSGIASAHSVVIASTPDRESSIAAGPAQASVTFNEALQPQFAALTVVGPDGNLWSRGEPTVSAGTISVDVGDLGPTGTYTIAYRVTSADGHPVTGTRTFELTTAGQGTPGPAADANAASDAGSGGVPLWPFLITAAVAIVGGLFFALRKKD